MPSPARWFRPPRYTDRCARHANSRPSTRTPSPTTRCRRWVITYKLVSDCRLARSTPYTDPSWAFWLASRRGSSIGCSSATSRSARGTGGAGDRRGVVRDRAGQGTPGRTLEIGAVGTFVVLAVLTFTLSQSFMERWMQPLSNAGIFLVALTSVLIGRPFVREFAEVGAARGGDQERAVRRITTLLTWIWVAAFAGMTVSSAIPPIVDGTPRFSTPRPRCRSSATG